MRKAELGECSVCQESAWCVRRSLRVSGDCFVCRLSVRRQTEYHNGTLEVSQEQFNGLVQMKAYFHNETTNVGLDLLGDISALFLI